MVQLPRKSPVPVLGESRSLAVKRFQANKRSLEKKGTWPQFEAAVREYMELEHAELVPSEQVKTPPGKSYYLPMHGVIKESSSTTKLRVVFDASAKSTSGCSLNDTLVPGPSLYPALTSILTRFRRHSIGLSADVSKMFREVVLDSSDRNYHRFLLQDQDSIFRDYRMRRLTFGVSSSPFLATQVLKQTALDHQKDYPSAAHVVLNQFYVDDVLTGSPNMNEAVKLRTELNGLLAEAGMKLRKWRSSSTDVLDTIPEELKESSGLQIVAEPSYGSKTLGIYWDTVSDNMHVSVPSVDSKTNPTKREVASSAAKVFDTLEWFAPAVVWVKVLLQKVWESGVDWDDPIPDNLASSWDNWIRELPHIKDRGIPR